MSSLNALGPGKNLWLIWIVATGTTLLWDGLGWDRAVMNFLGSSQGFLLQHHPVLELWLHDRFRQLGWSVYFLLWAWVLLPNRWRQISKVDGVWLMSWVTFNLLAISLIKNTSQTSCPWSVSDWGGVAQYVSHWQWGVSDGGPGRCFPGGHASVAWAFAPWVIAAWWPRHQRKPSTHAHMATVALLLAAFLTGVTQTLRGAHYPSHTAWTAIICTGISLAAWTFLQAGPTLNKAVLKQTKDTVAIE